MSQNPPSEIHALFKRCAFELPFVERRPSGISVPGAEAWVLPPAHACGPREAFMIGHEFAHVHPAYDGSSHLMLPLSAVTERLLTTSWEFARGKLADPTPVHIQD